MYYTIYQITNKINNKIYIGKHQTKKLDDGYMGSGIHLNRAISKYGIANFEKIILFVFGTESEMNAKEAELVTEEFCKRDDTYNLCNGGHGGFGYINRTRTVEEQSRIGAIAGKIGGASVRDRQIGMFDPDFLKMDLPRRKSQMMNLRQSFEGKHHSQKSKDKIGAANSLHQAGARNSQFGTMWITDGTNNRKIKKNQPIPDGWFPGRSQKQ